MKKVVLDINTVISGLLWDRNEAKIIEKAEKGQIQLFTSLEILEELKGVLARKKFTEKLENSELTVEKAITKINLLSTIIEPRRKLRVITADPEDNRILECASVAQVNFIISGDHHLLDLKRFEDVEILTSKEYLRRISTLEKRKK